MTRATRLAALSLITLFVSAALFALFLRPPKSLAQSAAPIDLLAFYCGARVLPADPYQLEPLHACEQRAFRSATGLAAEPYLVVPAPLPPFALLLLRPVGALSFPFARAVWLTAILLCSAGTVLALYRLNRTSPVLLVAALSAGTVIPCLLLGQIVPFILAALCGAAWSLQNGRPKTGALLAAAALIEPHVGLPVCLCLAVLVPPCRATLLAACGLLLALSLGLGLERNVEYLTRVLPAHARSEAAAFMWQYSLTALLVQLGAGANVALALGTLSYVGMLGLAIAVGARQLASLGKGAAVAVPAAFTLLGGAFVHIHQMAFALPLVVLMYPRHRQIMTVVLGLLAVPWDLLQEAGFEPWAFPAHAIPTYHSVAAALAAAERTGGLAENAWAAWVHVHAGTLGDPLELFLFKLPTWLALLTLVLVTSARYREPASGLRPATQLNRPA